MNIRYFLHTSYVLYSFACLFAFVISWGLTKPSIRWLKRLGYRDHIHKEFCEKLEILHQNKQSVPTAGGIVLVLTLLSSLFFWFPLTSHSLWLYTLAILCWGGLGWYDDQTKKKRKKGHGITAKQKFGIQCLFAACTVTTLACVNPSQFLSLNVPIIGPVYLGSSWSGAVLCFFLALTAIVGTSNAVNLADGLDGLAAGSVCISAAGCFFIASYLSQDIALLLAIICGSCLGFLWNNCSPAALFMGDTGSLLLGGMLGSCSVMLRIELALILMGGIFVIEAGSVVLQVLSCRVRNKRLFLCTPIHHHYEFKGIPETKVVVRFWILNLLFTLFGVISIIKTH